MDEVERAPNLQHQHCEGLGTLEPDPLNGDVAEGPTRVENRHRSRARRCDDRGRGTRDLGHRRIPRAADRHGPGNHHAQRAVTEVERTNELDGAVASEYCVGDGLLHSLRVGRRIALSRNGEYSAPTNVLLDQRERICVTGFHRLSRNGRHRQQRSKRGAQHEGAGASPGSERHDHSTLGRRSTATRVRPLPQPSRLGH